jgi:hypothetical protein
MARLGSWDIDAVAEEWFDINKNVAGWIDRDYVPFPASPPPPPPKPTPAPQPKSSGGGAGGARIVCDEPAPRSPILEELWRKLPDLPSQNPLVSLREAFKEEEEQKEQDEPAFAIVEVPVYIELPGKETVIVVEAQPEPTPAPPESPKQAPEQAKAPTIVFASDETAYWELLRQLTQPIEPSSPRVPPWVWFATGAAVLAVGIGIGALLAQPRKAKRAKRKRRRKKPAKGR